MTTFYITYEYWTPDGVVFYVGAGKKKRASSHLKEAASVFTGKKCFPKKCNHHKMNTIIELLKKGTPPIIKIVFEGNRDEAFNLEMDLIKKYGRADLSMGTLTNLNDGGYLGNFGLKMPIETKKNMSKMRQGNNNGFFGRRHTPENKKIQSDHRKAIYQGSGNPFYGKHHSEENKKKHSKILKEKFLTGQLVPHKHSDEHKKNLSIKYRGSSNPSAKEFIVTDPFGIETSIKSLSTWCKDRGFCRETFYGMLKNDGSPNRGNAKGWKIRRA